MIAHGERVLVDTGAWIALALQKDPLNARAKEILGNLLRKGARLLSSVPIVVETFTFLDRKYDRTLALRWRDSLSELPRFDVLECTTADLRAAWAYLDRKDFHRLGIVDATTFALMRRQRLRVAFAFDMHFAVAGFRYVD